LGRQGSHIENQLHRYCGGYGFVETLGIEMKDGRSFQQPIPQRNQRLFSRGRHSGQGLKDPVGKTVRLWGEDRQIIGVMKDFNFESLQRI
jgi:hypothetical protein